MTTLIFLLFFVCAVAADFVVSDSDGLDSSEASAEAYHLPLAGHARSRVFPSTPQYADACAANGVATNATRLKIASGSARRYFDVRPVGPIPGAVLYTAVERNTGAPMLFKSLADATPVAEVQREVLILAQIADVPDAQRLHDVLVDADHEHAPTLVFQRPEHDSPASVLAHCSLADVRLLGTRLLRLLDAVHRRCIIHGSVAASTVLVSLDSRSLTVTGWSSAVHYLPDQKRDLILADLAGAAPEMLFGMRGFNYAVDVWSAGVFILELLIGKRLFVPTTAREQAGLVARFVGRPEFDKFVAKYKIPLDPDWAANLPSSPPADLRALVAANPRRNVADCADLLDLLAQMLSIDPERRPTAQQALQHHAWLQKR